MRGELKKDVHEDDHGWEGYEVRGKGKRGQGRWEREKGNGKTVGEGGRRKARGERMLMCKR